MQTIIKALATFFYIGYLPGPRGTFSALAVLPLYFISRNNIFLYACIAIVVLLTGFLVCGSAEKIFGKKDAGQIVIDDAAGLLVALFLIPQQVGYLAGAFILYRLFDIIKIPPINRLEKLNGSAGVMLDDILAGVYANAVMAVIGFFIS